MEGIKYRINFFIIWVPISLYNRYLISLCHNYILVTKPWIARFSIKFPLASDERKRPRSTTTHVSVQKSSSMSSTLKCSKPHLSYSSHPKGASVDLFEEVLKPLEMIKCTEIGTRVISYGVIFTGLYHDIQFEFNFYINAQRRLNCETRQNSVWNKPVILPDTLRDVIDEVVQWVKSIDVGQDMTRL
jgi:hypothetical protein